MSGSHYAYQSEEPKLKHTTEENIEVLFHNFAEFLKEKNRRYGDAAIQPAQIFSSKPADEQLYNRLDDKLNRIKRARETGQPLKKNDLADVFGYVALALIKNGWTEFGDLID